MTNDDCPRPDNSHVFTIKSWQRQGGIRSFLANVSDLSRRMGL